MSVRGLAQGMVIEPDGSEVIAAASLGAWSLFVDDVTDFSEQSELSVNDQVITYTAVNEDTGELTLATPLAAAAAVGDRVYVLAGGQTLSRYTLMVSVDDEGDPVPVTIAFADRDLWPEAEEYDDPVPVVLSDDLDSIEDVPGRTPIREMQTPTAVQSMTVDGDLTAGGVTVTDGSTVVEVGPFAINGLYPGMRVSNGTKESWVWVDPGTGTQIQPDLDDTDSLVWLGAGLAGDAFDTHVFGKTKVYKTAYFLDELHGSTVYVDSVPTTANAANTFMTSGGQLQKSTSSRRYKTDIGDADLDLDAVLKMRPRSWVSRNPDDGPDRYVGFVAEEADELGLRELVTYDDEGRADGFAYPTLVTHLLALAQKQQAQIEALTKRVAALEAVPSNKPKGGK